MAIAYKQLARRLGSLESEYDNPLKSDLLRLTHINQLISQLFFVSFVYSLNLLSMGGNKITKIPNSIGHLNSLQALNLCDNMIEKIPASIERLTNLKTLSLHKNSIRTLPRELISLKNLTEVSLHFFCLFVILRSMAFTIHQLKPDTIIIILIMLFYFLSLLFINCLTAVTKR